MGVNTVNPHPYFLFFILVISVTPIFYANRSNWAQKEGKKEDNPHIHTPLFIHPPPPPPFFFLFFFFLNELIVRSPFW